MASGGAELWTTTSGAGPPLVLAHGGPGWNDDLGPVAGMLDGLSLVHRYDQRACGRSTSGHRELTLQSAVDDLEALREHWGHAQWVVGGHSWGALLALAYAIQHPERVRGLVHLAGPGPGSTPAPSAPSRVQRLSPQEQRDWADAQRRAAEGDPAAAARSTRYFWRTDFGDPARVPDLDRHPLYRYPRNPAAAEALTASTRRWVEGGGLRPAADLQVPTLLLHGRLDPLPVEGAQAWGALLPRSRLVVLEGVGHVPWLEDADAVRAALVAFLGQLPTP